MIETTGINIRQAGITMIQIIEAEIIEETLEIE